ncbi:hypothetical protein M0R45_015660 [Rubus argutus]|uniref:Uncharacterized protein n=1 Tax=Rubus argutus TaxID=59490 RepID=A0AAW1XSA5_RUBAR
MAAASRSQGESTSPSIPSITSALVTANPNSTPTGNQVPNTNPNLNPDLNPNPDHPSVQDIHDQVNSKTNGTSSMWAHGRKCQPCPLYEKPEDKGQTTLNRDNVSGGVGFHAFNQNSSVVNDENKSVVVLNLLHCRLSSQWILEDLVMVQLVSWWCTNAGILDLRKREAVAALSFL